MSIKINGGGSKENVIKAGASNKLLYNDKEVFLKENFGLLPPDLTKAQNETIADISPTGANINNPFTVPEDGWILSLLSLANTNLYITIDGNGDYSMTPSLMTLKTSGSTQSQYLKDLHCPYPVKKGQVIESSEIAPNVSIIFAPCMSV